MSKVKALITIAIVFSFAISAATAQNSKEQTIENIMQKFREADFLKRIDEVGREYYVSGLMWRMIDAQQKESSVTWFARHAGYILSDVDSEVGVTVKDNHSGKTLAEYSVWSGVTIK